MGRNRSVCRALTRPLRTQIWLKVCICRCGLVQQAFQRRLFAHQAFNRAVNRQPCTDCSSRSCTASSTVSGGSCGCMTACETR